MAKPEFKFNFVTDAEKRAQQIEAAKQEAARASQERVELERQQKERTQILRAAQRQADNLRPQLGGILSGWNKAKSESSDLRDLKVEISLADPAPNPDTPTMFLKRATLRVRVTGTQSGYKRYRQEKPSIAITENGYELSPAEIGAIRQLELAVRELAGDSLDVSEETEGAAKYIGMGGTPGGRSRRERSRGF